MKLIGGWSRLLSLCSTFVLFVVLYPEVLRGNGIAPRIAVGVASLVLIATASGYLSKSSVLAGVSLGGCIVFLLGAFALGPILGGDSPVAGANYSRFFGTFPVCVYAGILVGLSDLATRNLKLACIYVGSVTSVLAVIEYFCGFSLFGRTSEFEWLVRDGSSRALLGSEHSLVLGSLLVSCVPLGWYGLTQRRARVLYSVAMLCGVWVTGSRGAAVVGMAIVGILICYDWSGHRFPWRLGLSGSFIAGLLLLSFYSSRVWIPYTVSRDWAENSVQYRSAIYSFMPNILSSVPWGIGLGELPSGRWVVTGPDRYVDVTHSVDSQLVLSALRMGWPGVITYAGLGVLAIVCLKFDRAVSLSLLSLVLCGFFVAIDAWDGMGSWFAIVLGLLLGRVVHAHLAVPEDSPRARSLPTRYFSISK